MGVRPGGIDEKWNNGGLITDRQFTGDHGAAISMRGSGDDWNNKGSQSSELAGCG